MCDSGLILGFDVGCCSNSWLVAAVHWIGIVLS